MKTAKDLIGAYCEAVAHAGAEEVDRYVAKYDTVEQLVEGERLQPLTPAALGDSVEEAVSTHRVGHLAICAERMRECDRCRQWPPPCLEQARTGERVDERELAFVPCERFTDLWWGNRLRRMGVPHAFTRASLDDMDDMDAQLELQDWVDAFSPTGGHGLLIRGDVGVGKTRAAAAIVGDLCRRRVIRKAAFAYVPSLVSRIKDTYDMKAEDRVKFRRRISTSEVLVLDDLGAQKTTDWFREQMDVLLNQRCNSGGSIVVTTNEDLGRFEQMFGRRAFSRLRGMIRTEVTLAGSDRRLR